jgi:hypothetical protein
MTTNEYSLQGLAISEYSLERECQVFTHLLLGCAAHPYAVRKYVEAHHISAVFSSGTRFDLFLLWAARIHWSIAKLADGYARLFARTALLRKKLVLLLAILETSSPSCHLLDSSVGGSTVALAARLLLRTSLFMIGLIAGIAVFLPAQLALNGRRGL